MGIPKAKVLPDPVDAFPTTSCPARISGIASDWIGVGFANPIFERAVRVYEERSNSSHAETSISSSASSSRALKTFRTASSDPVLFSF